VRAWYGEILPDDVAMLRAATDKAVRAHAQPAPPPYRPLELAYPFGRAAVSSIQVHDARRRRQQLSFAYAPWQPLLGGCTASVVTWTPFVRRVCEQCGIVLSDKALASLARAASIDPGELVLAGRERRPHFELLLRTHFAQVDRGRTVVELDAHLLRKGFGSSAISAVEMMNAPKHGLERSSLPVEVERSEAHRCKQWHHALDGYSHAIQNAQDDMSAAAYYCYRAQVKSELHDTGGALADAQKACALAPLWARATFVRGECSRAAGEWRVAFDSYVRALRLEGSTFAFDKSSSSVAGACWDALSAMAAQLRSFSDRVRVSLASGGIMLHPVYDLCARSAARPRLRRCAEALRMYADWAQLAHQTLLVLPDVIESGDRAELPWNLMALSLTELFALSGEYAEAERWGLQALRLAELEPACMPNVDGRHRAQLAMHGMDMTKLEFLNAREVAVASAAGFLGDVYAHGGRYAEAILMYERARLTWLALGTLALEAADGGMLASRPGFSAECAQRMALLGGAYAKLGRTVPYTSERTPPIDTPAFWAACSRVPDTNSPPCVELAEAEVEEEERLERKLLPPLMQISEAASLDADFAAALSAISTIAHALLDGCGLASDSLALSSLQRWRGSEALLHELGYRRVARPEGVFDLVHSGTVQRPLVSLLLREVASWKAFVAKSLEARGMGAEEAQRFVANAGTCCRLPVPPKYSSRMTEQRFARCWH
jgi:tetratricopeptide (TPR) repeat protein